MKSKHQLGKPQTSNFARQWERPLTWRQCRLELQY